MIHSISLLLWWFRKRISAFYSTVSGRQLHLGDFLRHQEWREGEIFHELCKKSYSVLSNYSWLSKPFLLFVPSFHCIPSKWETHWMSHTVQPCEGICLSPVMTETEIGRLAPLGWSLFLEIPCFDSLLTATYQITVNRNRWFTINSTYASDYTYTNEITSHSVICLICWLQILRCPLFLKLILDHHLQQN